MDSAGNIKTLVDASIQTTAPKLGSAPRTSGILNQPPQLMTMGAKTPSMGGQPPQMNKMGGPPPIMQQ